MPPTSSNTYKRKASTAFKPPRPTKGAPRPRKIASPPRRKSAPTRGPTFTPSDADDDDEEEDDDILQVISDASQSPVSSDNNGAPSHHHSEDPPPTIPPKILTKLVHHHFPNDKKGGNTRINKDAMAVLGKYMETFVREAIARAAFERSEEMAKKGGKSAAGDDFLDVDDLEKLTPQLLLDF